MSERWIFLTSIAMKKQKNTVSLYLALKLRHDLDSLLVLVFISSLRVERSRQVTLGYVVVVH